MRAAFTLIEIIIALVLLQIGMLAIAATMAVAARDLGVANRRTRAQSIAENRVALLRPMSCAAPSSGSTELSGGLTEHWRVEGAARVRTITDSIVIVLPRGREASVVVRGYMLCDT
jgi:Tfp pilus assembly protein PilV